jgi:hypothetical protein
LILPPLAKMCEAVRHHDACSRSLVAAERHRCITSEVL